MAFSISHFSCGRHGSPSFLLRAACFAATVGLHRAPVRDAVGGSHTGVGGRLVARDLGESGVLHHDGRGPLALVSREVARAVRAHPVGHAGTRRASPDGVAVETGVNPQLGGMVAHEGDGAREVLAGSLSTGAVDDAERVVAEAGQGERMREAVVDGGDVGETASGAAECHAAVGPSAEEEETGVREVGVLANFFVGVDGVEDLVALLDPIAQVVADVYGHVGVYVVVLGKVDAAQGAPGHVALVHREDETAPVAEGGVVAHVVDGGVGGVPDALGARGRPRGAAAGQPWPVEEEPQAVVGVLVGCVAVVLVALALAEGNVAVREGGCLGEHSASVLDHGLNHPVDCGVGKVFGPRHRVDKEFRRIRGETMPPDRCQGRRGVRTTHGRS